MDQCGLMQILKNLSFAILTSFIGLTLVASPILADSFDAAISGKGGVKGPPPKDEEPEPPTVDEPENWMHSDILGAWVGEYFGQGVTITVVDDFSSVWGYYGDLGDGTKLLRHGEWTLKEASMLAPSARMRDHDFTSGERVRLARNFNVINLSYGMYAPDGIGLIVWGKQESSIISYAQTGKAVISKAAGNDGVGVGEAAFDGDKDYLNTALIGTQSAIFVGALDTNGSLADRASLAWYSNTAGLAPDQYLVVGVVSGITWDGLTYVLNEAREEVPDYQYDASGTGLAGTSFAAPIISGYAAVLASKFTDASPTQIASQLLSTAREDTILNYDVSIHGQGEASLSNALSPVSIF